MNSVIPRLDRGIQSFQWVLDCPVKPDNDDFLKYLLAGVTIENLLFPLFAKEGYYSSLWQMEVRRDFIMMSLYVSPYIMLFLLL